MSTVKRNNEYHSPATTITASPAIEFEMKDSVSTSNNTNDINQPSMNTSSSEPTTTTSMVVEANKSENDESPSATTIALPRSPADNSMKYNKNHGNDIISGNERKSEMKEMNSSRQEREQSSIDSMSVQSSNTRLSMNYSLTSNNIVRIE